MQRKTEGRSAVEADLLLRGRSVTIRWCLGAYVTMMMLVSPIKSLVHMGNLVNLVKIAKMGPNGAGLWVTKSPSLTDAKTKRHLSVTG